MKQGTALGSRIAETSEAPVDSCAIYCNPRGKQGAIRQSWHGCYTRMMKIGTGD